MDVDKTKFLCIDNVHYYVYNLNLCTHFSPIRIDKGRQKSISIL